MCNLCTLKCVNRPCRAQKRILWAGRWRVTAAGHQGLNSNGCRVSQHDTSACLHNRIDFGQKRSKLGTQRLQGCLYKQGPVALSTT